MSGGPGAGSLVKVGTVPGLSARGRSGVLKVGVF